MQQFIDQFLKEPNNKNINKIKRLLEEELYSNKGLIKKIREVVEESRSNKLLLFKEKFKTFDRTSQNLDEAIEKFSKDINDVNEEASYAINYNFLSETRKINDLYLNYPHYSTLLNFLDQIVKKDINTYNTLSQLIINLVSMSQKQSRKSQAGIAGEDIAEAILYSIGLEKDRDYRGQYKSKVGSNTDFVIPNVSDDNDFDVEIFIAVQISTNDRSRLVLSELKGGTKYLVSGNGLTVSTKDWSDLGTQNLMKYKEAKVRIVGYGPSIIKEIERIKEELKKRNTEENKSRLDYFQNIAFNFSDFAKNLSKRYSD